MEKLVRCDGVAASVAAVTADAAAALEVPEELARELVTLASCTAAVPVPSADCAVV